MARTLTVTKVSPSGSSPGEISLGGGSVSTSFDAKKARGNGTLRARYLLLENGYRFKAPKKAGEAVLAATAVTQGVKTYKKKLTLEKKAGAARALKVEIRLVVEEVKNGIVVGDAGPAKTLSIRIKKGTAMALASLLHERGDMSMAAFGREVGLSATTIAKIKNDGHVSTSTLEKLPSSVDASKKVKTRKTKKTKTKVKIGTKKRKKK